MVVASWTAMARSWSTQAITVAVGSSAAISRARLGPVTTAIWSAGTSPTSAITSLIRLSVPSSIPLARLTSVFPGGSSSRQPARLARSVWDGTANTTASTSASAAAASVVAVIKTGSGTFFLTGTNSFTGGLAINGGTVNATGDSNLGGSGGGLSFDNGATLQLGSSFTTDRSVTLNAGGGKFWMNGGTVTLSGTISGTGSLTTVAGSLTLTADNSYSGGTTIGPGTIRVLTWGGLKGGVSVALAMKLPEFDGRNAILTATYVVVVFSIVVQGLTVGKLIRMLTPIVDSQRPAPPLAKPAAG